MKGQARPYGYGPEAVISSAQQRAVSMEDDDCPDAGETWFRDPASGKRGERRVFPAAIRNIRAFLAAGEFRHCVGS